MTTPDDDLLLPPLPTAKSHVFIRHDESSCDHAEVADGYRYYSDDQMRAYARLAVQQDRARRRGYLEWPEAVQFSALLKRADVIVRCKPTFSRFVKGTPLDNDVAVWMVDFAIAAMRLKDELTAPNNEDTQ